jgi:hypothetical protein
VGPEEQRIYNELVKIASSGNVTYYGEFGAIVGKPARGPWRPVLDQIAKEEMSNGRPDITVIVLSAKGWPGRVGFKDVDGNPSADQKKLAQKKLDETFSHYCPGRPIVKLPKRKR